MFFFKSILESGEIFIVRVTLSGSVKFLIRDEEVSVCAGSLLSKAYTFANGISPGFDGAATGFVGLVAVGAATGFVGLILLQPFFIVCRTDDNL